MAQFSFIPTGESTELAADIRELLDELSGSLPRAHRAYSGECHPPLDVRETDDAVEVIVDVAGVPAEAIRVLFRAAVLVVAGEKAPAATSGEEQFHLVEREFGRFARVVRLDSAFDIERARATLSNGELTVRLPKIADRRGQALRIPITSDRSTAPSPPRTVAPPHGGTDIS